MRRLQLTAAHLVSAGIGGLFGLALVLALAESHLRRAARR